MAFITTQRAKWTLELFLLLLEYSSKRLCRNSSQNDSYKKALELFLFNSVKTSYLRCRYFISRRNIIQTLKWPRLSSYIILLWTNCPSSKRKIARFGMTKRNESICTLKIKYKEKRNQLFRLNAIVCQKQVFVRWCFYTITNTTEIYTCQTKGPNTSRITSSSTPSSLPHRAMFSPTIDAVWHAVQKALDHTDFQE